MDNFNALSKSAILTKLALDGYFIDLLTLNSFINEWHIEAIYENEFGIEFFDNDSYLVILNNLKDRYRKTKDSLEGNLKEKYDKKEIEAQIAKGDEVKSESAQNAEPAAVRAEEEYRENTVSLDELAKESERIDALKENAQNNEISFAENEYETASYAGNENEASTADVTTEDGDSDYSSEPEKEGIMPSSMRNLMPGPISPNSTLHTSFSESPYKKSYENNANEDEAEPQQRQSEQISEPAKPVVDDELNEILENENFTQEEIEKANRLMNKAGGISPDASADDTSDYKNEPDDIDLMELAQSSLESRAADEPKIEEDAKETSAADIDRIFGESYTEPFENLADFANATQDSEEGTESSAYGFEEYKSLQEDLPSDIEAKKNTGENAYDKAGTDNFGGGSGTDKADSTNLTAQNIRQIIREEISKQNTGLMPVSNSENIREVVREIIRQTQGDGAQNAFKLDISQGTLDMIAKSIAKKIATKLNDYYQQSSEKQNTKLKLFRERTIELKEKNQALSQENKKLKSLLLEANSKLNSYKPSLFGLFKYTGKRKRDN